jgi:hypothetical protein
MDNEKKEYEAPQMEITLFDIEDIITTSTGDGIGGGDDILP